MKSASVDLDEPSDPEDLDELLEDRLEALNQLYQDIRPHSLEAYVKLLTEVEKDYDPTNVKEKDELLNVTRDGAVVWTATEKEILYNVLDRKGFNGIKDIAIAIGTKSELEVLEHLRVVQKTIRDHLGQRHLKFITTVQIPAAAEVSEDYCAEERKYAKYLALRDEITYAHNSKLLYADYSVIRESEAQALSNADINTPLRGDLNRAVGLFNTPNWISLSKDILMNFGGEMEENHWTQIAETEEDTPSIAAEAIMDFSALAISLTRRLIQSSIFMAESRLRTTDRSSELPRDVKYADVKNALEIMGMNRKRPSFVDIVRRNRIAIGAFAPQRLKADQTVSYKQAEEILSFSDKKFYKAAHALEQGTVSNRDTDIRTDEDGHEYMDENGDDAEDELEEDIVEDMDSDGENGTNHPATSHSPELPHPETTEDHQLAEDEEEGQADNIDQERSRQEELRLWQMFEKPPPPSLLMPTIPLIPQPKEETDDEKDDLALHGIHERRTQEDLVNWRDRTLYHSEWEQYGSGLEELADELAENTRKRRRVEAGDSAEEERDEVIDKDTPVVPRPQLSADRVESEDDSSSDDNESDEEHPDEADGQVNESDHPRAVTRHAHEIASAPSPRKVTHIDKDDHIEPRDEDNEAEDEISSDSSSDSDSYSISASASAPQPKVNTNRTAQKEQNKIEDEISTDSDSSSNSNSTQDSTKANNIIKAHIPNDPEDISTDSDSDSDTNPNSSGNINTTHGNGNPEDEVSTDSDSSISDNSHVDAMDLDEDFHAQVPPNGFI